MGKCGKRSPRCKFNSPLKFLMLPFQHSIMWRQPNSTFPAAAITPPRRRLPSEDLQGQKYCKLAKIGIFKMCKKEIWSIYIPHDDYLTENPDQQGQWDRVLVRKIAGTNTGIGRQNKDDNCKDVPRAENLAATQIERSQNWAFPTTHYSDNHHFHSITSGALKDFIIFGL